MFLLFLDFFILIFLMIITSSSGGNTRTWERAQNEFESHRGARFYQPSELVRKTRRADRMVSTNSEKLRGPICRRIPRRSPTNRFNQGSTVDSTAGKQRTVVKSPKTQETIRNRVCYVETRELKEVMQRHDGEPLRIRAVSQNST